MQAKGVAMYRDLCIHLNGHGMVRLQSLHSSFTVSVPDLTGPLHIFHALMSQDQQHLVNIGEYICYSDSHQVTKPVLIHYHQKNTCLYIIIMQRMYAELLLCMQSGSNKLCLICPFQHVTAADGQPVNNEFDCPLLLRENRVVVIPVKSVLFSVSVLHECCRTCVFSVQRSQRRIEREIVDSDSLQYVHDLSNNLYSLNVYCMSHTWVLLWPYFSLLLSV